MIFILLYRLLYEYLSATIINKIIFKTTVHSIFKDKNHIIVDFFFGFPNGNSYNKQCLKNCNF